MASPFDIIESTGILPVIKIEEPETAVLWCVRRRPAALPAC